MDTTEAAGPSSPATREKKYLTMRQAAFIGVGAMVGAGRATRSRSWAPGGRASAGLLIQAAVCLVLDYGWKRNRPSSPVPVQVVP
jgi:hypothetical protein